MNHISISDADNIYSNICCCKITNYSAEHPVFRDFGLKLKAFEKTLGEFVSDENWSKFLSQLKVYRFNLCAAPLPFSALEAYSPPSYNSLKRYLELCKISYPEYALKASEILNLFDALRTSNENPLLELVVKRRAKINLAKVALLLKESRWIPAVENLFSQHPDLKDIDIITPYKLRGNKFYDCIFVAGYMRLFPEYVFTSPRAGQVDIIKYDWVKDHWKIEPAFINARISHEELSKEHTKYESESFKPLDADEMLPKIDWNDISERLSHSDLDMNPLEKITARLFLLEGGMGVFLEAAENSKVLIIDLEDDENEEGLSQHVKKIPVADIMNGNFLLLRTAGGGDYIVPIADKILGEHAHKVRNAQKQWKGLLREYIDRKKLLETSLDLLDLGSVRANEINVRNWISDHTIKPDDYKDFEAIMSLIGLKDKASEYWKLSSMLDMAHRKAGFQIRKELLRQVLDSDLSELERMGKMDFTLSEDEESASITAFRVIGISPSTVKVPGYRHAHPFEIEENIWQE